MIDPLARKLRFVHGIAAWIDNPPEGVDLGTALTPRRNAAPSFVLVFLKRVVDVERLAMPRLAAAAGDAVVWLAYPKKSSPLFEDLSRDHGWQPVEDAGWKGVAQVAINHDWSAMRFRRLEFVGR